MHPHNKIKILLLSVGGMVGQNALDALEGRRDGICLLGTNSQARNPRNFRCDKMFLVPPTEDGEAFTRSIFAILESETPDLVLAGRDDDVVAMAAWWDGHPEWRGCLTCGSSQAAGIMRDKLRSFRFAQERGLPFADSAIGSAAGPNPELETLIATHGFPLIAKPRVGCGSRGVYIVHDRQQVSRLLAESGVLFQEYLAPLPGLDRFRQELEFGTPLFFSLPDESQFACQTAISPAGAVGEMFCSRVEMVNGNPVGSERVDDPQLETLARGFAEALAGQGWAGPFNIQCKPRAGGGYAAFEMNGRMTGSTSARLCLGFDELGHLARLFAGPGRLGKPAAPDPQPRWVMRTGLDAPVIEQQVRALQEAGQWVRSS